MEGDAAASKCNDGQCNTGNVTTKKSYASEMKVFI